MKREIDIKKETFSCSRSIEEVQGTVGLWLQTCPNGEWVLKLEKKTRQRGLTQNALLWVWMEVMSKEWAEATDEHYTKEQWKEYFCRKFLPVTAPDGSVIGGSTSGLTVDEMTAFLTKIQVHAAENLGITLLGAEDEQFNQWRNLYE